MGPLINYQLMQYTMPTYDIIDDELGHMF